MFNNRKITRFNTRKYRKNIACKEVYDKWIKEYGFDYSFIEFKRIVKLIGEEYILHIIEERDGVEVGVGLGDIYIGYVSGMKPTIDYNESLKHNKIIYHENWHSGGKAAKIIYGTNRRKYIFQSHRIWSFLPHRNLKNAVKTAIRENPQRYKSSIEKRNLLK